MSATTKVKSKKKASKPPIFARLWSRIQPNLLYGAALTAVSIMMFVLIRPQVAQDLGGFKTGQTSPRVITAPITFEYIDAIETQRRISEAVRNVPPTYNILNENLDQSIQKIHALSMKLKDAPREENQPLEEWAAGILASLDIPLENKIYFDDPGEGMPATSFECLAYYKDYDLLWTSIIANLKSAAGFGVADNIDPLRELQNAQSMAVNSALQSVGAHLIDANGQERLLTSSQDIFTVEAYLARFEVKIKQDFPDEEKDQPVRLFAVDIAKAAYVGPTLFYNEEITAQRIEERKTQIQPVFILVEKNDTIIGRNKIVSEKDLQKLEALRARLTISPIAEIAYLILAGAFTWMVVWFLRMFYPDIASDLRKVSVVFVVILLMVALSRVFAYLSLLDLGSNKLSQVGYGLPLGALGVMLTVLTGTRLAMFCSTLTAMYVGLVLGGNTGVPALHFILVLALTSWSAIYTVSSIRRRSDLYRAGGLVILIASVLILAFSLQKFNTLENLLANTEALKWALTWGAVNGILVSILSIALLPIFEDLIGITTDIKLLEMTQKNELLQRLEHEAPGTYQHSMRVATLAETAADAIGANALLTRVGCYYHDIGKMEKAQYFVENQQTSSDRAKHSKLSPNMSCFIIRNHVKNGLDLAKQYKLPKVITDFIPEHHGTTLMTYFYHEALANQENEGKIKEDDFRYPGPKPQSRETAIVMLSDSLEAASRTLDSISERDVRQLVRKIINDRFMDTQFDECDLTMKDLNVLYHSYTESIMHMLHQRISYPSAPIKAKSAEMADDAAKGDAEISSTGVAIKSRSNQSEEKQPEKKDKKPQESEAAEKPVAIKDN